MRYKAAKSILNTFKTDQTHETTGTRYTTKATDQDDIPALVLKTAAPELKTALPICLPSA